ncbi:carboxypeptidase regulatory-like domain-containing protein, partial [Candidatus Bipolaricaulota bacterium]|nr:carboxypeptidase regulatory-like domain-containing protein [Candidatus Bipolaricaulota bacterium]
LSCAGDGQIRIQGPVTLRNDGCGDALAGDVLVRFRVFDDVNCTGSEIDTFTVSFSGMSLASNGGTDQQNINVVRTLAVCIVPDCQLSIEITADDNDAFCECSGDNNTLCAGNFAVDFPDLTITDIDFSQITCSADNISGMVRVAVENTGCGDSCSFVLRLATDGCLNFSDETVANVAAGGSTTVDFAITGSWADCGDCSCTFTATIDPEGGICECDGTDNILSEPFVSTLPDLEISGVVAAIGCAVDGNATVSADVTVENTGCSDVAADFDIRVTVYDGANCTGDVVDTWIETISGETIAASGSNIITLTDYTLAQALCAGDCDYSAQFEVDANNDICECDGTDNLFCLSSILSQIPNLVVTDVDPVVDCQAGTAQVTATVGNTGCGDATGTVFRLTSPACGLSIDSTPVDLAAGESQDIVFAYTPNCSDWNCTYIVTADPNAAICECDGENTLTFNPYPGIGSIGDRVWFDFNGDGAQDPGEDGIGNVTVIIEGDLDGDGSIDFTAETTTDANGEYLFEDLPAGDYTLTVDATTLPEGLDQTYDYDGLVSPHTSDYALAENEHNREQDFGYRGSGSIGDYVWFDINGDGIQDPSESGIENVTVTLRGDVDGDGIIETLTTTTDADGLY